MSGSYSGKKGRCLYPSRHRHHDVSYYHRHHGVSPCSHRHHDVSYYHRHHGVSPCSHRHHDVSYYHHRLRMLLPLLMTIHRLQLLQMNYRLPLLPLPLIHHSAAAADELSPAAAAAAADPPLAAAAAELSPAAANAAEDAKACSEDTLTPIIAVIITTAKITGTVLYIQGVEVIRDISNRRTYSY